MRRPPPRYVTRHVYYLHRDYPFTPPCVRRRSLARLRRLAEMNDDWPSCPHCGSGMGWEGCGACEDGQIDAYELDPMWYDPGDTEPCQQCAGVGGWWFCWNTTCPGKQDGPPERVGAFGEPTEGTDL